MTSPLRKTSIASTCAFLGATFPIAAISVGPFDSTLSPIALTTAVIVKNCKDNGPGSLRQAVLEAGEGGQADLTQLVCSTISLGSEILIPFNNFDIVGPPDRQVTISGNDQTRVILHTGDSTGVLTLQNLRLVKGKLNATGVAKGGCIFSSASLHLENVRVSDCSAQSTGDYAAGGGLFAEIWVQLFKSTISGNRVSAPASFASGGGLATSYGLAAYESEISYNRAEGLAQCGGACVLGSYCKIIASTIADNVSDYVVGGLGAYTLNTQIINSTISGNIAKLQVGALQLATGGYQPIISNSTIAFNSSPKAAGVYTTASLRLYSSIIALNTTAGPASAEDDFATYAVTTGMKNLIMSTSGTVPVAPGVISLTAAPNLNPLMLNGGNTRTHLLQPGSPGIGSGNNHFAAAFDQQGRGHPRSQALQVGTLTDMGAVQFDTIFADGAEP